MAAAVLQGVPVATEMPTDNVAILPDNSIVNFNYHAAGLKSFASEYRRARKIEWFGKRVAVLPLERICKSKRAVDRPKDRVHIFYLKQAIALQKRLQAKR
jgi:hypothetical protein